MASVAYFFLAILAVAAAAPDSRIVGGDHVTIEESPYVVSLTYLYPGPGITVQRCVGTLVSSFHAITTAFCYTGAVLENFQIRAGSTNSLAGGVVVGIANVVKHPDYTETPRSNDIAVTFLSSALGISNTVNVLYLPPVNYNIPDGQSVKVVSWGFESETGAQLETLKSVYLNKLSVEDCQAVYADSEDVTVSDAVICAAAPGKGMCRGDSGAPMVMNNALVGISSFFQECLTDVYPDVFTRVDRYTNWILGVASSNSRSSGIRVAPVAL
ncbi:trypsin, alkaline C-like [Helicoverpa zea]|uniref:trypsin, alkaline C-like n=1 Tax=Helicoverpa zea TaxID=7113 RepID=UPI001F59599D|nr:trypsin, alkaline C-like [Helicoverpa zea]